MMINRPESAVRFRSLTILVAVFSCTGLCGQEASEAKAAGGEARRPVGDDDLRFWLENAVLYHRFTDAEIGAAIGLRPAEIADALTRFSIDREAVPPVGGGGARLVVLPYPGGRHPRVGFLEGALRPQRETKVSVFTPWDPTSYVVADVPEAIWSNLGLTYLAHTHIDTVWTKQGITTLPRLEWKRGDGGVLEMERTLPNGIRFGTRVTPSADAVRMSMWLTNGTDETLRDLRVQNCVMFKGARGFTAETNGNKHLAAPYAACRSDDGERWVITAWDPCHRAWANPPVPCLHSDPKFPDCAPGETKTLSGWLSFYEGDNIAGEIARIEATGWRDGGRDG
jgi:hypothetical protein